MTTEVRAWRHSAFQSVDKEQQSVSRANLRRGVKEAKRDYKSKAENHLVDNNLRVYSASQMTGMGNWLEEANADASLVGALNHSLTRGREVPPCSHTPTAPQHPSAQAG